MSRVISNTEQQLSTPQNRSKAGHTKTLSSSTGQRSYKDLANRNQNITDSARSSHSNMDENNISYQNVGLLEELGRREEEIRKMLYENKPVKTTKEPAKPAKVITKDTSLQDKTNRKNLVADLTGKPDEEEECTFKPKINERTKKMVKRSNTDQPVNEILYKSALDKKAKEKEAEAEARQTASKIANSNKISVNSMKIVFKRIEGALRNIIRDVENSENLSFEGLGVLLQKLGVFKSSEFGQEEISNRSSLSMTQAKVKQQTLAKEAAFHENFFRILANASSTEDVIQGEVVFRFLMVLLEDKASVPEAAMFLQDIMNIALEERGFKPDKKGSLFERIRKDFDLWDMEKVVTEFRKLFSDKTIFMNIYSNAGVLSNKSAADEQPSFRPQINSKSKNLDNAGEGYRNKMRSSTQLTGSTNKLQNRFDMLFEYHKYQKERENENMETKIEQELAHCTFKPQITEYKNKNRDANQSSITYTSQEISKAKRHDLLYDVARVQKEKLTQKAYEAKKQEEVKQLSECTFQPRINTNTEEYSVRDPVTVGAPPKGYSKAVQRMKAAEKIREEKRAEREHVPRGENYEKLKNSDFKPPSFLSRPKNQKNEALVYVDVNIGPGKTGRIGIHRGDDARTLARNFARTYSLPPVMKESLEKLLQNYIDSYFPEHDEEEYEGQEEEDGEEEDVLEEEEEDDEEEYEQERYEQVGEMYQHREPVKEHDEEDEEDDDEDEDDEEDDDDLDLEENFGQDDDDEEDDSEEDEEDEAPVVGNNRYQNNRMPGKM